MNLQQLAIFREIMKSGSISQAARNLHRTQPAVSASLKTLEADLGMPLFLREGRRLVPVPEAYYLLSEASEVIDRLKTAHQNLTAMHNRTHGHLRIVAMPGPSSLLLPNFIRDFIADTPDVKVTLTTRSSPQVRNLIAAQSYDFGFCDPSGASDNQSLYNRQEIECHCLCAISAKDPLASKPSIAIEDLDARPMGGLQREHVSYRNTFAAFRAANVEFNLRIETQYFLPLFSFIEAGQISAIVDPLSALSYLEANPTNPKVRFLPLRPKIPFGYSILTPGERPLTQLASSFLTEWKNYIQSGIQRFS